MSSVDFCAAMRMANEKQKALLLHVINKLLSNDNSPLQIFFTGPAGCGKTFVIKLIMEIYNRFSDSDGYCNAYITCASTRKSSCSNRWNYCSHSFENISFKIVTTEYRSRISIQVII